MKKELTVLSLFDGIACGMQALKEENINVKKYYASEINEKAIMIAKKNHNDIIHIGDVRKINGNDYKGINLLIGGSPCQSFSFAGSMCGMTTTKENIDVLSLEQYLELKQNNFEFAGYSYLFWEFVRLLKETNPKYFLLENVKMAKKWQDVISNALGCKPIEINSGLMSAQDRKRLYWTNIPNITQPIDKHIYIDDIVQNDIKHCYLPTTRLDYKNYDIKKVDKTIHKNTSIQIGNSRKFGNEARSNGKAFTLRRVNPNGILTEDFKIREFTPVEAERLQTLPDNYTLIDGIKKDERYEAIGNGWTIAVIRHIFSFLPDEFKESQ